DSPITMASFKAAALTTLLASAGLVSAQGFFYQEPFACSAEQDHKYLGCVATNVQPFGYNPTNPDGDPSRSYFGYAASGHVNSTVTPKGCVRACRGHGFKYAAMFDRGCRCGTDITGLNPTADETPCTTGTRPCAGDGRENCGSSGGARIYVDPSFQDSALILNKVSGYGVLGCFYKPNLPTGLTVVSEKVVGTAADCLTFCAASSYPLAYMAKNAAQINCKCGQDFGVGSRTHDDTTDQFCQNKCDGAAGDKGCTGQNCCGDDGQQVYPVYANPDFMGCNIPRIPGYASSALATPGGDQYTCIATPQSILARATHTVPYLGKAAVTRSASFVATATAAAATYINFGCYPDADRTSPLNGQIQIAANTITGGKISVDNCIAACQGKNQGLDWVGLRGVTNGGAATCLCGTGKGNLGNSADMEVCNLPCDGDDNTQNCGPDLGILAYAVSASATTGDWYTSWSSTFSSSRTYSCTPTDSSSSTGSVSTTSSATVSTTSSASPADTSSSAGATST
ncbi:WSC domain-containing protein, partial [Apiospora sp. TS-2023a]